jgi:hypothetical protein
MRRAVEREELIRSLNGEAHQSSKHRDNSTSGTPNNHIPVSGTRDGSSSTPHEAVTAPTLAAKEGDILKRMMEAAIQKKAAKAAAAAELLPSTSAEIPT